MLCRMGAKELSSIKPILDAHNVRLIGIGLEELGLQEFIDGNYFNGELFLDVNKQCYTDLEYKRYNLLNVMPMLFSKDSRDAIKKGRQDGISNNFKGDGLLAGGMLIVSAGGEKTLYFWKQENFAVHVDPKTVLEKCGIDSKYQNAESS